MRVLVTGAAGQLGSKVTEIAVRQGHDVWAGYHQHKSIFGYPLPMDLLDSDSVHSAVNEALPDIIIHCAALTDVDLCERDPSKAHLINTNGTRFIAEAAEEIGSYMLYVSTDYVFSGTKGDYTETDQPNPMNVYGKTKLDGEQYCKAIARTSSIFGNRPVHWSRKAVLSYRVAYDLILTPTLDSNLALMLLEMASKRLHGIYHLAGASSISKLSFIRRIAGDPSKIIPVRVADLHLAAHRPPDSSLNVTKASVRFETTPLLISDAIKVLNNS